MSEEETSRGKTHEDKGLRCGAHRLPRVYDRCLATQVLSVTGTGDVGELHVSNDSKAATLVANFDGMDEFDQPVSISVDLVRTGVGPRERTVDHVNEGQGILRFRSTSSGTIRDGVATGSVVVEGTDETPQPSNQGTIEKNASHELVVYR